MSLFIRKEIEVFPQQIQRTIYNIEREIDALLFDYNIPPKHFVPITFLNTDNQFCVEWTWYPDAVPPKRESCYLTATAEINKIIRARTKNIPKLCVECLKLADYQHLATGDYYCQDCVGRFVKTHQNAV
jgi:hypothetical protein